MRSLFRFTIRDIVWGVSVLALVLGWAADRQWRWNVEGHERLQAWQFECVAAFLKHETKWTATTTNEGNVHFSSADHNATYIRPEHLLPAGSKYKEFSSKYKQLSNFP
jgi:hypothetical protein